MSELTGGRCPMHPLSGVPCSLCGKPTSGTVMTTSAIVTGPCPQCGQFDAQPLARSTANQDLARRLLDHIPLIVFTAEERYAHYVEQFEREHGLQLGAASVSGKFQAKWLAMLARDRDAYVKDLRDAAAALSRGVRLGPAGPPET